MAFFDELSQKVSKLGQDVTQKTQSFTDGVKINSQISDQKKSLSRLYEDLGRIAIQDEAFCGKEEAGRFVSMIREGEAKLKELERQLSVSKGEVVCEKCGSYVPAGTAFCQNCGNKMEVPVQPQQNTTAFCPECGQSLEEGAAFCTHCGTRIQK